MKQLYCRAVQRNKLLTDGRIALRYVNRGMKVDDILVLVDGSRPRLYRAMRLAREADSPGSVPAYAPFVKDSTLNARRKTDAEDSQPEIDELLL